MESVFSVGRRVGVARGQYARVAWLVGMLVVGVVSLRAQMLATIDGVAVSGVEATPRFAWTLRASDAKTRGVRQTSYEVRVASSAAGLETPDLWESGQVASDALHVSYGGKPLPAGAAVFWQVRSWQGSLAQAVPVASPWTAAASFVTPLGAWQAHWIGAQTDKPGAKESQPLPLLRKSFRVGAQPTSALLFTTGLGQYEARLNGQKVGEDVLTPGWTDDRKRVLYDSYDVLALLKPGAENALGVMLGNGMYNVPETPGRYTKFTASVGEPKLIAELHLRFADGSRTVIASDGSWKTHPGPITFSGVYGGEDFDARLWPAGWDAAGFDERGWTPALAVDGPGGVLVPEETPPIRVVKTYSPVKVTHPRPNVTVYDLGQNFAGWPSLRVSGPAGATVRLLGGELLTPEGEVTQASANAFAKDPNLFRYTLRGDPGGESWTPRFSYYGFRYVQAEVSDAKVEIGGLEGQFLHASVLVVGSFSYSGAETHNLFNGIHGLIDKAILSNMMSVLTDCPHREKLGWLEQTHLAAASIMLNYDVSALYRKMEDDMADAQLPPPGEFAGLVPATAPEYVQFNDANGKPNAFRDTPEWGSAVILSPWAAFQAYGDPAPLRAHYASMERYVAYLRTRAKGHILAYGLGDWYDIGPGEPGPSKLTGRGLTATAIFYQDLATMARIAALLDKTQDAAAYAAEAETVRGALNAAFFHAETNEYDRGSQTANAMPLALGIVPEEHRGAVLANLIHQIEAGGYHVTAGDIGFHYVVRALTDGRRSDVLYKMISLTSNPSYGYQLAQGATTLTEAWDANPKSSQNHFMLGHAEEWFYRGLAGIDVDLSRPAGAQIRIQPYVPPSDVEPSASANASVRTPLGEVAVYWTHAGRTIALGVTIPPGAEATLTLPEEFGEGVGENGGPLSAQAGVHAGGEPGTFRLVSGSYRFRSGAPKR